jgi:hypothetical protein
MPKYTRKRYRKKTFKKKRFSKRGKKIFRKKVQAVINQNLETKQVGLQPRNYQIPSATIGSNGTNIPAITSLAFDPTQWDLHYPQTEQGTDDGQRVGQEIFSRYTTAAFKIGCNNYGLTAGNWAQTISRDACVYIHQCYAIKGQIGPQAQSLCQNIGYFLYDNYGTSTAALNANSFNTLCSPKPVLDPKFTKFWIKKTKIVRFPYFGVMPVEQGSGSTNFIVMKEQGKWPSFVKFTTRNKKLKYSYSTAIDDEQIPDGYPSNDQMFYLILNATPWVIIYEDYGYMTYKDA